MRIAPGFIRVDGGGSKLQTTLSVRFERTSLNSTKKINRHFLHSTFLDNHYIYILLTNT